MEGQRPPAEVRAKRRARGGLASKAMIMALLYQRPGGRCLALAVSTSPCDFSAAPSFRCSSGGSCGGGNRGAPTAFSGFCGRSPTHGERGCAGVAAGGRQRSWPRWVSKRSLSYLDPLPPATPASLRPCTHNFRALHARAQETSVAVDTGSAAKIMGGIAANDGEAALESTGRTWENAFSLDLPEGCCIGVRLVESYCPTSSDEFEPFAFDSVSDPDHWVRQCLHPSEIERGLTLSCDAARGSFFLGRMAIRMALLSVEKEKEEEGGQRRCYHDYLPPVSQSDPAILRDENGRPTLPSGYLGSISHKGNMGVALVCSSSSSPSSLTEAKTPMSGIGVDIERTHSRHRSVARRVLTKAELAELGKLEGVTADEEVLLRFSLKESVYKAMHPLLNQYVGFQEAEITPRSDGTADVRLFLKSGAHERLGSITAHWRRVTVDGAACASYGGDGEKGERIWEGSEGEPADTEEFFLSSASVRLRDDDAER